VPLHKRLAIASRNCVKINSRGRQITQPRQSHQVDSQERFLTDRYIIPHYLCLFECLKGIAPEASAIRHTVEPEGASESTIRPISTIPDPELQVATWDLAQAASPQNGPTKTVVSKVARAVKTAICRCVSERKRTVAKYFQTQIPAGRIAVFAPYPETLHVGRV
jgi:hypothetical protein